MLPVSLHGALHVQNNEAESHMHTWSGILSPVPCRRPPITSSDPGCSRIRCSCCALPGMELRTGAMDTTLPLYEVMLC